MGRIRGFGAALVAYLVLAGPVAAMGPTLNMPLEVNGAYVGDIPVSVGDEQASFPAARFLELLGEELEPALVERLRGAAREGRLTPSAASRAGVETRFNRAAMAVEVTVGGDQRRVRSLSVVPTATPDPAQYTSPEPVSGYVNLRAAQRSPRA